MKTHIIQCFATCQIRKKLFIEQLDFYIKDVYEHMLVSLVAALHCHGIHVHRLDLVWEGYLLEYKTYKYVKSGI